MNTNERGKNKNRDPILVLMSYFRAHIGLFLLDIFAALIATLIDLSFPLVARKAMYEMLPNKEYRIFFTVMIIAAIAFLLRITMNYIITYWGHMFGVRVEADLRSDLFRHIQTLDFSFFDRNRTGVLMNRVTGDLFEITELSHHGPEDVFIAFVTIAGAIIIMFTIRWQLALVILIVLPICIFVIMLCRKKMVYTSKQVKVTMAEINSEIEMGISGIRTSRAFANEKKDYEKFLETNEVFKSAKCENYKAFATFISSLEYFMCIMPVVIMAFGGWLIMRKDMNYIDLVTFYLYIATFINPIRKLANFMEIFINGYAGMCRFAEIMATEPEIKDPQDPVEPESCEGLVELKNVHFSYNDTEEIIKGVNIRIEPGEKVAIVGPSGGGKSTICQLIPRFYDVDSGSVCLDGLDIRSLKLEYLRKRIGVVQQDVYLFADTVRENIRYGDPMASDDDVFEAARKAEILDDILDMPDGFDSYVGERGVLLSGGQKQRISIARIFLKNPSVLILDEATSALDTITEAKIQSAFDKLAENRTSIVIAHRLSTIRNSDRILLLDEGAITESGTHDELIKAGGRYAGLYRQVLR